MQIKYCLPIIKSKKKDVLKTIENNIRYFQHFEVWLDYIDDLDDKFLRELMKDLGSKVILVLRRKNLEKIQMSLQKRLDIILLVQNSSVLIDFDIFDQKPELDFIQKNKILLQTIISYHNYSETPIDGKLKEITDKINVYKPTILKVATFCKKKTDALRLLDLLLELREKNRKSIILGMGDFGVITRIFGTLWGNEMIFAPRVSQEQSAPGQLTRNQLQTIFNDLKG